MTREEKLELVEAFAFIGLVVGILLTAFTTRGTAANDAGVIIVIITFTVNIISRIILRVMRRKEK